MSSDALHLHCFAVHKDMAEFGTSAIRIRVIGSPCRTVSCEVLVVFFWPVGLVVAGTPDVCAFFLLTTSPVPEEGAFEQDSVPGRAV